MQNVSTMAKAIDDALARSGKNQEFQQARETLRQNEVTVADAKEKAPQNTQSQTPSDKQNAVGNALDRASNQKDFQQAREKLKQNEVSPAQHADKATPQHTPSTTEPKPYGLESKQVDAQTKSNIESVQKSEGNNYQNAVEKAQSRPAQEAPKQEKQQQSMER